jgi:PAS domain S-box-containing protein
MSLRRRTLLFMMLGLIAMIALLYAALRQIIVSSFETIERDDMLVDLLRAEYAVNALRDDLFRAQLDWSSWSATQRFVTEGDPAYAEENLTQDALLILNIDFMLFLDTQGEEVYWLSRPGYADSTLITHDIRRTLTGAENAFFTVLDGRPAILSARPILDSQSLGEPSGTLVWGQIISDTLLARISTALRLAIRLEVPAPDALYPPRGVVVQPNQLIGSSTLRTNGDVTLCLIVTSERTLRNQAEISLLQFFVVLIAFGIILVFGSLLLLDQLLLRRVSLMIAGLRQPGVLDGSQPLRIDGNDELTALAGTINGILGQAAEARRDLQILNSELEGRVMERTAALMAQEAQIRTIIDTMGEGVIYNIDGEIALVNPALAEMLGYPAPDALIGKAFRDLLGKPEALTTQSLAQRVKRFESQLVRADGTPLDVAITSTPLPAFDGKRRRVIVVRDITQERMLARQRDYFFARASHELRTPLTNIMTRLYLIERAPEQTQRHLQVLNKVARNMLVLLNDLLTVARLESSIPLNRQAIDLRVIAREVLDVQKPDADAKGIATSLDLPDCPVTVQADPVRINQALTNLVRNAVLYTPEGGWIRIRSCFDEDTGRALLIVSNSGAGIEAEHLPHLFDPFFRVTEGGAGAGLGLFITREILELHGGTVSVISKPGDETSFTLALAV